MSESGLSASDVLALTRNNNDMFSGNWGGIVGLLIIAGIFGGGLFGNNRGYESDEFIKRDIFNTNSNVLNAKYDNAITNLTQTNELQKEILGNRYETQLGFANLQADNFRCCCDIKNLIREDGEKTRALIQANTIQDLRDKIADKDREALATGLSYSQTITTRNSEDRILGNLGNYYPKTGVNPWIAYNGYGTTVA